MTHEPTNSAATVSEVLPTRTGYDRWASIYDTDGNPLVALEEPLVERLLGDVRSLSVLDVGCGTGRHALRLASAGAVVPALDFSPAMLEQAAKRSGLQRSLSKSMTCPNRCRFQPGASTASCAGW